MMYCCEDLAEHVSSRCEKHDAYECPDKVIINIKRGDELRGYECGYGLPIHDGGSSYIEIKFCPWCGADLATEG